MPDAQLALQSVGPLQIDSGELVINTNFPVGQPAVGSITYHNFAVGDNIIAVPTGSKVMILETPSTTTAVLKLKGAGGDTGIVIHPTLPLVLSLGSTVTLIYINSSAIVTGVTATWI